MPVTFTTAINDLIEDPVFSVAVGNLDSLSFRYVNLQPGTYIEVNGISWGFTAALGASTANIQGRLFIIRNEIFDPFFNYGNSAFSNFKDLVLKDIVSRFNKTRNIDFAKPLRLAGASSYLIICGGFTDPDAPGPPGDTVSAYLAVRAKFVDPTAQGIDLRAR